MRVYGFYGSSAAARLIGAAAAVYAACAVAASAAAALIASSGGYQLESSVVAGGVEISGGGYSAKNSVGEVSIPDGSASSSPSGYVNRAGFYNPPRFTFQNGLPSVVTFNSGSASLVLPAGSVDKEVFDITLNKDPVSQPLSVDPSVINSANSKITQNNGAWAQLFPGQITEMILFDEQSLWGKPFASPGVLTMRYKDDNNDGIIDGSNPPVRTDTMRPWILDQSLAMWAKIPDSSINTAAKTVSAQFLAPGVYALLGTVDESVKDTYAFPVPFRPDGPKAGSGPGQTGTEAAGITFINVPQTGDIEIYTLDGRLVNKLAIPSGLVYPTVNWNVRTSGGQRAASGVYIWRVVSGSNSKTGKLMVIW
jgi:hypothetical protein